MTVLLLELNEINFDYVRGYVAEDKLPFLGKLIAQHGVRETTSERNFEELEPWIQWVTAHTGKSFAEHGVFRLGDMRSRDDIDQIWEVLERRGVRVGAVSPMNAVNRCRQPAFFIPDPWTKTTVSGPALMKLLHEPITQAVNDNATGRLTAKSFLKLAVGAMRYARTGSYARYAKMVSAALRGQGWQKAMVLDQLLADTFIGGVKNEKPGFASLFLNAGAHIQHHYMFNSAVYDGPHSNPDWYVSDRFDPVFDIYAAYDRIVQDVMEALPDARVLIATGLHQNPYPKNLFYWRLKDHAKFLSQIGLIYDRVEPRMSRDFVIYCADIEQCRRAQERLSNVVSSDGRALFDMDNRGSSLFVTLTWPEDIGDDFKVHIGNEQFSGFRGHIAFVAIKNGDHDGIGYFIDTGKPQPEEPQAPFPLTELPERIYEACGV